MVAGKRFHHEDKKLNTLISLLNERFRTGNATGGISATFPIIRKWFPYFKFIKREIERDNNIQNFFRVSLYD